MKQRSLIFCAVAVLSLALFGCPPKEEPSPGKGGGAAPGNDIPVGEYGSLTGLQATFGQSTHNGIIMAADEINAAGGVKGRKIKVITEDDQSKQEEAANAVTKLISQNNVVAVLGEVASSNSLAAGPICQSNKIPMITPSSTNVDVTKKGDYIFRMCFVDSYQGKALADFTVDNLKVKHAAILRDVKSDYALGLSQAFHDRFAQLGGEIVADQSYANGDADFRAQLTAIKQKNPGIVFCPGYYNDIGQIANQMRDLGMAQPLVGGDGWESPKLFEIGGKALDGCYYSNHYHSDDPSPEVRRFVEKYKERFGVKPDALTALGYDAMKVLGDAMNRAPKIDPKDIRDALATTRGFHGVTGIINMGPDRNPVDKKLVVLEIRNGITTLAATVDPSKGAATAAPATPADTTASKRTK
jgi:branched-chain amino acid transport system substrate-binding protein